MQSEITWQTTDLPLERIQRFFGKEWVDDILSMDKARAFGFCASRAAGAWNANERETYAMYRSLAHIVQERA